MSDKPKKYRIPTPYYRLGVTRPAGSIVECLPKEASRTWVEVDEKAAPAVVAPAPVEAKDANKSKRPSDKDVA